eukprot:14048795-Alexandrium_andersonii.AAC.1
MPHASPSTTVVRCFGVRPAEGQPSHAEGSTELSVSKLIAAPKPRTDVDESNHPCRSPLLLM